MMISAFKNSLRFNQESDNNSESENSEDAIPHIMAKDHEVQPITNLLKQLDQMAISEEKHLSKKDNSVFQRYDYTQQQKNDIQMKVSQPGNMRSGRKGHQKRRIMRSQVNVDVENSKKRKMKTLESFMIIQEIRKFCTRYAEFFEEINRYYHDFQKIKSDIIRIVEGNFEESFAEMFLNGFIKKGRLIKFTNVSHSKIQQQLNDMLE